MIPSVLPLVPPKTQVSMMMDSRARLEEEVGRVLEMKVCVCVCYIQTDI